MRGSTLVSSENSMAVPFVPAPTYAGCDAELRLLVERTAIEDARVDGKRGDARLYQLMATLFADGDVQPDDWTHYCCMYMIETANLLHGVRLV